jgi:dihydroorotate dehydrogenase
VNGIIATNTTSRRDLAAHKEKFFNESGGLSGRPLAKLANSVIQRLYKRLEGKLPIIGVGGVFTAEDAFEKIACGASLIQVYTGFIYQGPSIAAEINRKLSKILSQKGFTRLEEAIGCGLFEEV